MGKPVLTGYICVTASKSTFLLWLQYMPWLYQGEIKHGPSFFSLVFPT